MDDNELSTLVHSLADVSRRDKEDLAFTMRSRIAEIDRYADAVEQCLRAYGELKIEKPAELLLPMPEAEQRAIHAALEKAAKDLESIRANVRREMMHRRRPKYQIEDDCPF
jgi:hypothetical protein